MSEPKYGVIETGVPITGSFSPRYGVLTALLSKLQVGESTLVSADNARSARSTLSRLDGRFVTRTVDGGVRIWRVE